MESKPKQWEKKRGDVITEGSEPRWDLYLRGLSPEDILQSLQHRGAKTQAEIHSIVGSKSQWMKINIAILVVNWESIHQEKGSQRLKMLQIPI